MNDLLDDHSMDDDHRDVLVDHRMSDLLVDHSMDDVLTMVVNLLNRMSQTDVRNDLTTVVNLLNRNCALRDLKMDVNLGAMSHRVMLTDVLNKSCDQMSHDHLRCDRLKMRHYDMNRMDGMNLDGKMTIHHVNHPKMDDRTHLNRENHLMMVCRMKI